MEQVLEHYDKDSLKMAMLKHEETFRQQVHELHRLYRIQKLLMRDLKRELRSQRNLSTSPNGFAEYSRAALDAMRSYEQCYGGNATRGGGHRAAMMQRAALSLDDVVVPAVEYAQSGPEEDAEGTDDDDEAELQLTLAVGSVAAAANAKKRYSSADHSPRQSFSSSVDGVRRARHWRSRVAGARRGGLAVPPQAEAAGVRRGARGRRRGAAAAAAAVPLAQPSDGMS
ncbi:hypothetical protein GUJ93_ZPchr0013g34715 [Zizania palustris]|uniref:Uncharacterized protein n=1 Tax=Zizania palustris TaxID=103762 RepID=A0A8J5WW44_ZIZPA|nr:hypothetical protein GUJ93_ZPchr0013g34715 [Zizania palustris]